MNSSRGKRTIEDQHNIEASDSHVAEEHGAKRACRVKGCTSNPVVDDDDDDDEEPIMIKVHYEEDIIKFEFIHSTGISKLFEKVATKLNLEVNTFKLKYMDECKDEIMITDDDDLELCCYSQMAVYKTFVRLLVRRL